jgi:hypothetical protein
MPLFSDYLEKSMLSDPAATTNPLSSQADFTYSITPTALVIKDTGKGAKTVLEDLPALLRRIEHWHQDSVAHLKLTGVDTEIRRAERWPLKSLETRH